MVEKGTAPRTRGYKKRERTRRQLLAAGQRVLAEKGEGLAVSDVVAEAEVSNGTFYNYFVDRDALIEALAEQAALSLAASVAREPIADPARRFASATAAMILRAREDEAWARVMLRLVGRPGTGAELGRYLREDLAEGRALGRFDSGPDDDALDQATGLVIMTLRRIVDGLAQPDAPVRAVERGLRALGIDPTEAAEIAAEAVESWARATEEGSESRGAGARAGR